MALRDQPYLPLYVQDFLTDEKLAECSASSTGVYIRLLCLMHKSESYGSILLRQKHQQTDDQILNFANMLAKVMPFDTNTIYAGIVELLDENVIQMGENEISQKRMVHDNNLSVIRSESGSLGGKKTKENRLNFAVAKKASNAEIEYESNNHSINTTSINKIEFEVFWILYDKKVGKRDKIKKKWDAIPAITQSQIIEHIPKYKISQPDKKFRKNPETYLNNESWNDELISSGKVLSIQPGITTLPPKGFDYKQSK